jgi:hypothetical protein
MIAGAVPVRDRRRLPADCLTMTRFSCTARRRPVPERQLPTAPHQGTGSCRDPVAGQEEKNAVRSNARADELYNPQPLPQRLIAHRRVQDHEQPTTQGESQLVGHVDNVRTVSNPAWCGATLADRREQAVLTGVAALKDKVDDTFEEVINDFEAEGAEHIKEQMRDYTQLSNDTDWIDEMVDWFGFPRKSVDEIKRPIEEWLEHQLGEMLRAASDQVLNA